MDKKTGLVDKFKKMNIIEKLKQEHFNIFDLQRTDDYIRIRDQPVAQKSLSPEGNNDYVQSIVDYEGPTSSADFYRVAQEYKQQITSIARLNETITSSFNKGRSFMFAGRTWSPPRKRTKPEEEQISEQIMNHTSKLKGDSAQLCYFDFQKVQNIRQRQRQRELNLQKTVDEGEIPFVQSLADINNLKEIDQISKTFRYTLKQEIMTSLLKMSQLYNMAVKKNSVVPGQSSLHVNFERDLGESSRKPVEASIFSLAGSELTISSANLRYCDIMNLATGRLTLENMRVLSKNTASVKQELDYNLSILRMLQNKTLKSNSIGVPFSSKGPRNQTLRFNTEVQQSQQEYKSALITQRLVSEINQLKFKIKSNPPDVQTYNRFQGSMRRLLEKAIEGTGIASVDTLICNFKEVMKQVGGLTNSGFQKQKLLWFYADCARYIKKAQQDENIKYLIKNSTARMHTVTTVIKENLNRQDTKAYKNISRTKVGKNNALTKQNDTSKSLFKPGQTLKRRVIQSKKQTDRVLNK